MGPLLYGALTPWYRLLDPPEDHLEEGDAFAAAIDRVVVPRAETLLELGAGAGHNALHLKRRFRCTLVDLAPAMSDLSRALNPECEHQLGDMRSVRLGRHFDAVLIHDAIAYMTTVADLAAAVGTAFAHTRPGGAAIFAPDFVRETFADKSELHQGDDGTRALRCLEWCWDPDPGDDTYLAEYAFLLREGGEVRAVHDRHHEGLFARATWHQVLSDAGFEVQGLPRPIGDGNYDDVFLCRRP